MLITCVIVKTISMFEKFLLGQKDILTYFISKLVLYRQDRL